MGWPVAILTAVIGAFALWVLIRFLRWIRRDDVRIVIPWTTEGLPLNSPLAQRLRTRIGSHLSIRNPDYCALIFWKSHHGPIWNSWFLDLLSGCSGVNTVGIDFSHVGGQEPWLITAHAISTPRWQINGPHYAPFSAHNYAAWARLDVSCFVDVRRLLADLEESVSRNSIRFRGLDLLGHLMGRTRLDEVTCSGLIGRAILKQPDTALAQALTQALATRFTWGEITPGDLARAVAILGLTPEGQSRRIVAVPVLSPWREARPRTR